MRVELDKETFSVCFDNRDPHALEAIIKCLKKKIATRRHARARSRIKYHPYELFVRAGPDVVLGSSKLNSFNKF